MNRRMFGGMFSGGGPGGMPPFLFPFFGGPGPEDDRPPMYSSAEEGYIPPRVLKAMEFLEMMWGMRVRKLPAASDNQVIEIDQPELTGSEQHARDCALQLMAAWFDNKLEPNEWEKLRMESINAKLQHMKERMESQKKGGGKKGQIGSVIRCFACNPSQPHPNCMICGGHGKVLVQQLFGDDLTGEEDQLVRRDEVEE